MERTTMNSLRRLLLVAAILAAPAVGWAGVFVSVAVAPPLLPVYVQPLCPGDGYIWTPGYWAWGPAGYYWVPGVWVLAPQVGYLWTPPYWGWSGGFYVFHSGYWGPHIGFYGGVNYGFGYFGHGYEGGAWQNGRFAYNRMYNNINVATIHNTYVRNVAVENAGNRVSFNGGQGGVQARPMASENVAAREAHVQPTATQMSHQTAASQDRSQLASVNGGKPGMAAARTPEAYRNVAAAHAAAHPIQQTAANSRALTAGSPGRPAASAGGAQPWHVEQARPNTVPGQQNHVASPTQTHTQAQPQTHSQPAPRAQAAPAGRPAAAPHAAARPSHR